MSSQTPKGKMEDTSNHKKPHQHPPVEPRRSVLMRDKHMSLELVRMLRSAASSLEGQHFQGLHRRLQAMDTQAHSKLNNHRMACRNSLNMAMRASLLSLRTDNPSTGRRREDMSHRKQHIQHRVSKGCSRPHRGSSR